MAIPGGRFEVGAAVPISTLNLDDSPGAAIKAGPGLLFGWHLQNAAGAITYVQVFDAAAVTDVTLGTTTPKFVIGLIASGHSDWACEVPIVFGTGIVAFATTTPTGSTAATVHGVWMIR